MEGKMVHVALDRIVPNPWQVRESVDLEYVKELAEDILVRGLLQPPAGRVVNGEGKPAGPLLSLFDYAAYVTCWLYDHNGYVQLAFGHNRLAAYRYLAAEADAEAFATIPIQVAEFSDEDLALAAWSENVQRKDLSPLEEARAIDQMMTSFDWTQSEVAERVGLARSTVANKLRLLELPEEIREKVDKGEVPERSAIALKAYYDLPEPAQEAVADDWQVSRVLKEPEKYTSDKIREAVNDAVRYKTWELEEASFPLGEPIKGECVRSPICLECPALLVRKEKRRCPDRSCFTRKTNLHQSSILAQVATELGIPALERGESGAEFSDNDEGRRAFALAQERDCEHLRVGLARWDVSGWRVGPEDHPRIYYCCTQSEKKCTCRQEVAAGRIAEEKERKKEVRRLKDRLLKMVTEAILAGDVAGLRAVLVGLDRWSSKRAEWLAWEDPKKLAREIARKLISALGGGDNPRFYAEASTAWMEERGFSTDNGGDPLAEIRRKLERIRGFLEGPGKDAPPAVLEGNHANLQKLIDKIRELIAAGTVSPTEGTKLGQKLLELQSRVLTQLADVEENVCAQTSEAPA